MAGEEVPGRGSLYKSVVCTKVCLNVWSGNAKGDVGVQSGGGERRKERERVRTAAIVGLSVLGGKEGGVARARVRDGGVMDTERERSVNGCVVERGK